jgi:hypothetical protein
MQPLFVAKDWKDRKIQQALLQPKKPEHREILRNYARDKRNAPKSAPTGKWQADTRITSQKRTVVDVPKGKLGPKLFLDTR